MVNWEAEKAEADFNRAFADLGGDMTRALKAVVVDMRAKGVGEVEQRRVAKAILDRSIGSPPDWADEDDVRLSEDLKQDIIDAAFCDN